MIRITAVLAEFDDLAEPELTDWIARGWIQPEREDSGAYVFDAIDVARIGLIRDLRHAMAIEAETLPLVLSLVDQVYGLRRALRRMAVALHDQPEELREVIRNAVSF